MAATMAGAGEAQHPHGVHDLELSVPDEVEEQFELVGESTPYLRSRARREERMAMPGKDAELLSDGRRLVVGQFLMTAISQIWTGGRRACLQKVWFDGMQLCDVVASRGLDFGEAGAAAHCAAVLRILWKADDGAHTLPSESLSTLTDHLRRHGVAVQTATPEDIDAAESRILRRLGWQIWSPSLHSWLAAFYSRLRVLVKQHLPEQEDTEFGAVLMQLWQQSYTFGTAVVMHVASLGLLAPRNLGMGLLGLGFVRAGALPLQSVRPGWLGAAEWEHVYVRAMGPVPACKGGSHADTITQLIQLATDSSIGAVKDACGRVAMVVPDVPMLGARETVAI
jgi:hypothetical protein